MNRTILALSMLLVPASLAQSPPSANYDESKAGSYILPDPLVLASGKRVRNAATWREQRRPEILRLFEENMHGHSPPRPHGMSFDVFDKGSAARDGKAIRKQITIHFTADKSGRKMDLLLYVPAHSPKPVPVLLHLSFTANSLSVDDPGVKEGLIWNREKSWSRRARAAASASCASRTSSRADLASPPSTMATSNRTSPEVFRTACAVCF